MVFVNQASGELFSDVVDRLRHLAGPHFLIAGSSYRQWNDVKYLECHSLQKTSPIRRILTWGLFTSEAFCHLLRHSARQHILFVTNPPMTMWMGPLFKTFRRNKYSLLVYDIYPDVLINAEMLSGNSGLAAAWRRLNAITLRGASKIITLGEGMAQAIRDRTPDPDDGRVSVVENWVDTDFFRPMPKRENPLLQHLKLADKFIVAYAGSFGASHGVGHVLQCARTLKDLSDIHFLLVGGGTEEDEIKQYVGSAALKNVTLLPFQPREKFRYVAAAPDVSLILLKSGMGKSVMPSKVYTALSAGTAVLAAADADSDLAKVIERKRCGIVIDPEDPQLMADNVVMLCKDSSYLSELKNNARSAAVRFYGKRRQCEKLFYLFHDDLE